MGKLRIDWCDKAYLSTTMGKEGYSSNSSKSNSSRNNSIKNKSNNSRRHNKCVNC